MTKETLTWWEWLLAGIIGWYFIMVEKWSKE